MSLLLLYKDELQGYYKSKIMIILWIGMPLITILMRLLQFLDTSPGAAELPFTLITILVVSQIGGTLSSVMLSTSIVNEKNKKVYDLFLIRPVKRYELILAKYFAVISCLIIAIIISLIMGIIIDFFMNDLPSATEIWRVNIENLIVSLASMSISCCLGILFGIAINSVVAAAILSLYVGNQLSSVILIVVIFINETYKIFISSTIGIVLTIIIMAINLLQFIKKQF